MPTDTDTDAPQGAQEERREDATAQPVGDGPFGGLSASEAAKARWEKQRAREAEEAQLGEAAASPPDHLAQLEALATTAKSETVRQQALRTLLEYRRREGEGDADQALMDRARQQLFEGMTEEERQALGGLLGRVVERQATETPA